MSLFINNRTIEASLGPLCQYKHCTTATTISGYFSVGPELNLTQANVTTTRSTPRELTFNSDSLISVIIYSTLFVIAALGNVTVFTILFRNRRRKSRVNLFIMNLSLADMIVTFVMLPLEIGWHITVGWTAGEEACRALMFFRVLGFYLSSFILIAISLDRYFAVIYPLSLNDADRRGKIMLTLAWVFSVVASIPQVSP